MKVEGTHVFKAPRDKVWEALLNPQIIARCVPGCEELKEIAPDHYEATMKVGVAGVKGTYKGKIVLADKRPPEHYILRGEGSGSPGFCKEMLPLTLRRKTARPFCVLAPTRRSAA